jgi:hypothetical protein
MSLSFAHDNALAGIRLLASGQTALLKVYHPTTEKIKTRSNLGGFFICFIGR